MISIIYNLSEYEEKMVCALLTYNTPVRIGELYKFGIPRTKIYGTMKKLIQINLVEEVMTMQSEIEKPTIWKWWPVHKKKTFLSSHNVGIIRWSVKRDIIRARFNECLAIMNEVNSTWVRLEEEFNNASKKV